MAETVEPPPLATMPPAMDAGEAASSTRPCLQGLGLFAAAFCACFLAYLAVAVPGNWYSTHSARTWVVSQMSLTRGSGLLEDGELLVTGVDASGTAVISVETDFRSSDYRAIAWDAIDIPDQTDLRVLWRTDYAPGKLNSARIAIAAGRPLPVVLAHDANWIGRIRGIALLVQGPMRGPFRLRGAAAKPMSALETAGDRAREWFRFEGFTGTSVDGVTGGDDVQELPLPALLAISVLLAGFAALVVCRAQRRPAAMPAMLAAIFIAAWLAQDVRWFANLVQQTRATALRYAGLDWRDKHLAAEDGAVFAFIQKVREKLPPSPARVFVVADAHYFRDRAAYHLYPHNVLFDPYANTMPDSARLRSGDFIVVYQRRGVQYDPGGARLRWDGGTPLPAELMLTEAGSGLFRIR